jgi:hypothetical protein
MSAGFSKEMCVNMPQTSTKTPPAFATGLDEVWRLRRSQSKIGILTLGHFGLTVLHSVLKQHATKSCEEPSALATQKMEPSPVTVKLRDFAQIKRERSNFIDIKMQ